MDTQRLAAFFWREAVVPSFGWLLVLSLALVGPAGAAEDAGSTVTPVGGIYHFEIEPMMVEECARCHSSHYRSLRERGGKHGLIVCGECHQKYHAYSPRRNNFDEIMPRCGSCHEQPHGDAEALRSCLGCHSDPHQPLALLPEPELLEQHCRLCHGGVAASLREQPSRHTEQKCSACHSQTHGRIPACGECHDSHSPEIDLAAPDCLACHPVHTPLRIVYPVDQDKRLCGGCHAEPLTLLTVNETRHSALTCAKCHPSHGQLIPCTACHGEPHGAAIHRKFNGCGECHGIAHDLAK